MPNAYRTVRPDDSVRSAVADEVAIAPACRTSRAWAVSIVLFTAVVLNVLILRDVTLVIVAAAASLVAVGGVLLAWLAGVNLLTGLRRPWRQRP